MPEPRGRNRSYTDEQLRQDLADGLNGAQIAEKRGVSKQGVYARIKQLEQCTVAAAVAPAESQRHVAGQLHAMQELLDSLGFVKKLRAACDEYLQDPDRPDHYDVGPRASEITVIYLPLDGDGKPKTRKPQRATLDKLLREVSDFGEHQIVGSETKHADPRTLILSTLAESRAIVGAVMELAKFLASAQRWEDFREEMLAAIAEADPATRDKIVERLRRRLVLHAAVVGPDALPE